VTDRLLSAALERIPELEAPSEPRESPETVEEEPERAEPRPDPLRVSGRIAPSFGDFGDYKHLSASGEYPQSRISILRCYKRYRGRSERGAWKGDCRGIGAGLCRILDMNFREFLFHELG
jgi:hypothetical protein